MSKEHNDIKNLDELLSLLHDDKNQEALDPFEQEALEGFASMGDEDSARDLVSRAQTRMYKRLERKPVLERKKPPTYWLAAAGVILIAALSVVFYSLLQENIQTKQVAVIPSANPVNGDASGTGTQTGAADLLPNESEEQELKETVPVSPKPDINTSPPISKTQQEPPLEPGTLSTIKPNTSTINSERAVSSGLETRSFPPETMKSYTATVVKVNEPTVKRDALSDPKTTSTDRVDNSKATNNSMVEKMASPTEESITYKDAEKGSDVALQEAESIKKEAKKVRERTKTDPVTTFASSSGAAGFSPAFYQNGQKALSDDLHYLLKKDSLPGTLNGEEIKASVTLNESNRVLSVTIISPVITDKAIEDALKKAISALNGFRTAFQSGNPIKSTFEFTFKP